MAVIWMVAKLAISFSIAMPQRMVPYAGLPPDYLVLVFPGERCSQAVRNGETCPGRGVLAAKSELESGTLKYFEDGEGTIRAQLLAFLPPKDEARYLAAWRRTLRDYDFSEGTWSARKVDADSTEVILELHESENDRRQRFVYVVKNGAIVEGSLATMDPVKLMIVVFSTCTALLLLLLGLQLMLRRPAAPGAP